jgi:hypothetical protein
VGGEGGDVGCQHGPQRRPLGICTVWWWRIKRPCVHTEDVGIYLGAAHAANSGHKHLGVYCTIRRCVKTNQMPPPRQPPPYTAAPPPNGGPGPPSCVVVVAAATHVCGAPPHACSPPPPAVRRRSTPHAPQPEPLVTCGPHSTNPSVQPPLRQPIHHPLSPQRPISRHHHIHL